MAGKLSVELLGNIETGITEEDFVELDGINANLPSNSSENIPVASREEINANTSIIDEELLQSDSFDIISQDQEKTQNICHESEPPLQEIVLEYNDDEDNFEDLLERAEILIEKDDR